MAENKYYSHTSGQPVQLSRGASAAIRAELSAIAAAFAMVADDLGAASSSSDFRLIYQGARSADPTQRYNGTQLQDGDLYFNTGAKVMKSFAGGAWYAMVTSQSVMTKDGGTFTGTIKGTSAEFSGNVSAGGFIGNGSQLTGLTLNQITSALQYTPLNKAGGDMTGNLGGTTANFSGTILCGNLTMTSDERGKEDWVPIRMGLLSRFAQIERMGTYRDKTTGQRMAGVGAQSLQKLLPEAVSTDADGNLSVGYGQAALVLVHKLTQKVLELEEKIQKLEK